MISRILHEEPSTIQCLQGFVMLSFNMLQHDVPVQTWLMVGRCTRLAYELDLHNTDVDLAVLRTESIVLDIDKNVKREENDICGGQYGKWIHFRPLLLFVRMR